MGRRAGDTRIEIMVSPEELASVQALADDAGLTLSNYGRERFGLELRTNEEPEEDLGPHGLYKRARLIEAEDPEEAERLRALARAKRNAQAKD